MLIVGVVCWCCSMDVVFFCWCRVSLWLMCVCHFLCVVFCCLLSLPCVGTVFVLLFIFFVALFGVVGCVRWCLFVSLCSMWSLLIVVVGCSCVVLELDVVVLGLVVVGCLLFLLWSCVCVYVLLLAFVCWCKGSCSRVLLCVGVVCLIVGVVFVVVGCWCWLLFFVMCLTCVVCVCGLPLLLFGIICCCY